MPRSLLALVALAALSACPPPGAGGGADNDNGDLLVEYVPAETDAGQLWETAFQDAELPQILADAVNSAYALPHDVTFKLGECGMVNAFWNPNEDEIVMCWELVADMARAFYDTGQLTEEQAVEGATEGWIWAFFHELGHALIDLHDLPTTGQEEDAVDEFSTLLLIEMDYPNAATSGATYFFLVAGEPSPPALADEHSLGEQRFYNVLCLVYGADPSQAFRDQLVAAFPEMDARLDRCEEEYTDKQDAWSTLLEPYQL